MNKEFIKIANCSGFYGDKLSAAKDLVEGGPIDVLTGDYLAELTMAILFSQKMQRGEDKGYVGTFLKQINDIAKSCKEKNIKIVSNAGGLNPKSMADEIEKILRDQSVDMKVAYIDGDDLRDLFQNKDYSRKGREANIRLGMNIAAYLNHKKCIPIISLVSPYRFLREEFKSKYNVIEVYLHTTEIRGRENFFVEELNVVESC